MSVETVLAAQSYTTRLHDVIVIGSGPVGMRLVAKLVQASPSLRIAVFGDEPWHPYARAGLTSLLAGETGESSLYIDFDANRFAHVSCFFNNRIVQIDRYAREVLDSQGQRHGYRKLVLATGSKPRLPNIPGINLENVFGFHGLSDVQKLLGRALSARNVVIIGGGLLGLETARALQRFNIRVTVIEHSLWLMFRQLDQRAGSYLKRHIEALGVNVRTSERVVEIMGNHQVKGVLMGSGEILECDSVIVAAGTLPNIQLVRDAGLHFGRGVRVNDCMQTSDPNIYAIGECAEHRKKIYGLASPGYAQADVLARHLSGGREVYQGSVACTTLKIFDYPVFSLGEVEEQVQGQREIIYQDHKREIYRKLILVRGRLKAVIAIGNWPGMARMRTVVAGQNYVWPWQAKRFLKTGELWRDGITAHVEFVKNGESL